MDRALPIKIVLLLAVCPVHHNIPMAQRVRINRVPTRSRFFGSHSGVILDSQMRMIGQRRRDTPFHKSFPIAKSQNCKNVNIRIIKHFFWVNQAVFQIIDKSLINILSYSVQTIGLIGIRYLFFCWPFNRFIPCHFQGVLRDNIHHFCLILFGSLL